MAGGAYAYEPVVDTDRRELECDSRAPFRPASIVAAWDLGVKRRVTAFVAGRICESFLRGSDFEASARRFRISRATAEDVVRRWQIRARRKRR